MNKCLRCENETNRVLCDKCDWSNTETKKKLAARRRNLARKERDAAMRSLGLVKVRGALGGTYWEQCDDCSI